MTDPSIDHFSTVSGSLPHSKVNRSGDGSGGLRSSPTLGFSPSLMKPISASSPLSVMISPAATGTVEHVANVDGISHPLASMFTVACLPSRTSPSKNVPPQETLALPMVSSTNVPASPLNLLFGPGPGNHRYLPW